MNKSISNITKAASILACLLSISMSFPLNSGHGRFSSSQKNVCTTITSLMGKNSDRAHIERNLEAMMDNDWRVSREKLSKLSNTNKVTKMDSKAGIEAALTLLGENKKLKSGILNNGDKNFFRESCMAIGRAFAGNEKVDGEPVVNWAFRGYQMSIPQKEKYQTFTFMMGFSMHSYLSKGAIAFGHRSVETSKNDDKKVDDTLPGSTLVFYEFDPTKENQCDKKNSLWNKITKLVDEIRIYLKMKKLVGILPSLADSKLNPGVMDLLLKRGNEIELQMNRFHLKYGPAEHHWYISCVGVDPDNQGRGYGKQLMKQMNDIADTTGRLCYLECATEKNRGFYEKFGYEVVGTEYLCTSDDPIDIKFYLMVRTPAAIKQ